MKPDAFTPTNRTFFPANNGNKSDFAVPVTTSKDCDNRTVFDRTSVVKSEKRSFTPTVRKNTPSLRTSKIT